ncbi:MAG: translocation/assembly module TamB domain-containing protein, partial [Bacteroidales bacterium]|nr:translocation/assembly module TamB domain-containing protein [Bacteroidales bacterium]
CIKDYRNDTMLYARHVIVRARAVQLLQKRFVIQKIIFDNADVRLRSDSILNLTPLVRQLTSGRENPPEHKMQLNLQDIEFTDSRFAYTVTDALPDSDAVGVNFSDIRLDNMQLHITELTPIDTGGVTFRIDRLSGTEQSGLELRDLSADLFLDGRHMAFYDWHIGLPDSDLHGDTLAFAFSSFRDFGQGRFRDHVTMCIDIDAPSRINLHELGYFVSYFYPETGTVEAETRMSGQLQRLQFDRIFLKKNNLTKIDGRMTLQGLPRLDATHIQADFATLSAGIADLHRIRTGNGTLQLPEIADAFSYIAYKGRFDGFGNDFATRGLLSSDLGDIRADVRITQPVRQDADRDTSFLFSGDIRTETPFALGRLAKQAHLGDVTLEAVTTGALLRRTGLQAKLDGTVQSIAYNNYVYQDIPVHGTVHGKRCEASLTLDDPNAALQVSGSFDRTGRKPRLAVDADLRHAYLHPLHLNASDSSAFMAFRLNCDLTGTGPDDAEGELNLSGLDFTHNRRTLHVDDLLLFTKNISETKRIILRSEMVNAELWGQYEFAALPSSFLTIWQRVMPSAMQGRKRYHDLSENHFDYEIEFRECEELTTFLAEGFRLAPGSNLHGTYHPKADDISLICEIPFAAYGEKRMRQFAAACRTDAGRLHMDATCNQLFLSKKLIFDQLDCKTVWQNDTVRARLAWDNMAASMRNSGDLSLQAVSAWIPATGSRQLTLIQTDEAINEFTYNDRTFAIDFDRVVRNGREWDIDRFYVGNEAQSLHADGSVSARENEPLTLTASGIDLTFLSQIAAINRMNFSGSLDGTLQLSSLHDVPQIISDFTIADFAINDQYIGHLKAASTWQDAARTLEADIRAVRDTLQVIEASGKLLVDNGQMDFDVQLADIPTRAFHPFLEAVFSDVTGYLGGQLHMGGPLRAPVLNGVLDVTKTGCTVDYTQTAYAFRNSIPVENNTLIFRNIGISDSYGHNATINGSLAFSEWSDILFDMALETRNLEVLNTTIEDNNIFYGHAFAGGRLGLKGSLHGIVMNINMTNTDNTQIIMPLELGNDVSRTNFITFVNPMEDNVDRRTTRRRRRPAAESNATATDGTSSSTFEMNMTLNVTPQAEIQLVFDSKIGDILRGNGSGTFNMSMDKDKNFSMLGTYTIEKGDYLFTLQNVINKKFTIEEGGTVIFNGDPEDAYISVRAKYRARPSLYDLTGDESLHRRTDVDCIINISNSLSDPTIAFEIDIPNADQEIRSYLSSQTTLEDDMTKQFLSLLVMNSFYTDQSNLSGSQSNTTVGLESMGLTTASEFLSSQLSRMISGLSKNVDIGVSYRPSMETGSQDVAFNLSTDVISLSGNVDVGNNRLDGTANDNILSDFAVEVRLNKRGTLLFKAFNRANNSYLFQQADYTQGIGFLYREDFDTFKNLALFRRKPSPLTAPGTYQPFTQIINE